MLTRRYADLREHHTGDLVNRLSGDVGVISDAAATIIPNVVMMSVRLLCAMIVLVRLNWRFALVFGIGGILIFLFARLFKGMVQKYHKAMQQADGRMRSFWQEIFENLAITYNEDLWKQIFQELNILSYFKWYNYCEHLKYNFKTFSVEGLSSEQLKDFEYIHTQILPKSNPNRIITANDIESFQRDHSPCCEYELTNGHDFIKRFCHHLKAGNLTHRQENENSIRNRLHPCFRLEAFVQTQLYQDISDWENANGSNILKRPN